MEVSFEVIFRTLHDARLSLGSRELFIQRFKWLTGFAMVIRGRKDGLRAREIGVWCWYNIWRSQTLLSKESSNTHQDQMERSKRKGRTAKLRQRSKALTEWEETRWRAERGPLRYTAVEKEPHLFVWQEVRHLAVEE